MKTKTTYVLCDDCAAGVANDDWTHLDMWGSDEDPEQPGRSLADTAMDSITATLEYLGWLTHVGPADEPGYFDCAVCDGIQCGGGVTFEGEERS